MASPAFIVPLTAHNTPLTGNIFRNKVAPKVPHNIARNPPFCYFTSFSILLLTLFLNKPYFPSKLTICMISFTSLLKIINVAVLDPSINIIPRSISSSVSDAVVVNAKFIKKLLVMILKMHLETLLIVLFYATGFLRNYSTLTVLFGKSKTVSFASSIM